MNCELPDVQAGFRKCRGTRDQIANIHWIIKKARGFQKTSTSALLTMPKPLTVWITTNSGKFFKRWEYKTIPMEKKHKKVKWLSWEALRIVEKRREVKSKGEKEIYKHLNAEFQKKKSTSASLSSLNKAFNCMDHNKLWKILQEMRILDHLTCLLRNLCAGQEATVRNNELAPNWERSTSRLYFVTLFI